MRAVEYAGCDGSKRWLEQVAAGRERDAADLSTVAGYTRVLQGAEVRRQRRARNDARCCNTASWP